MKLQKLCVASAFFATGLAFAATAATPHIDAVQTKQAARIEQGVASGELTQKEAAHLDKQQNRIAEHEGMAKADGKVTKKERMQLHRQQRRASHAIHHQKHDKQKAK
ncbi:MAG: hypothetical protein ACH34Y_09065 [Brachymonas sp.]|jgi:hypothetical protein